MKISLPLIILIFFLLFTTSCSLNKSSDEKNLRLGYMPNVTHATALVGIEKNIFQDELGSDIKFRPVHFVVGNSIIDAFITNQIDAAYIGPGPFINAIYRQVPIKLLANAAEGGTVIVGIKPIQKNLKISVPQYGNTQDLILRLYLRKNDLLDKVKIIVIPPQDTGTTFFTKSIDVACLPEPWGTILIENGICKLLVNEKDILNKGNYPVTVLVVNKEYEKRNSELVKRLLIANKKADDFIRKNPDEAVEVVTSAISKIAKKTIEKKIIAKAFARCIFKDELDLKILRELAEIGVKSGYYREGFSLKNDENNIN